MNLRSLCHCDTIFRSISMACGFRMSHLPNALLRGQTDINRPTPSHVVITTHSCRLFLSSYSASSLLPSALAERPVFHFCRAKGMSHATLSPLLPFCRLALRAFLWVPALKRAHTLSCAWCTHCCYVCLLIVLYSIIFCII